MAEHIKEKCSIYFSAEEMKRRWLTWFNNYKKAKGPIKVEMESQIMIVRKESIALNKKKESICWGFQKMDKMFGKRASINPPHF
jgi:hypothetical protein